MQLQLHRGCGTVTQSDKIPSLGQSVGTHTHTQTHILFSHAHAAQNRTQETHFGFRQR